MTNFDASRGSLPPCEDGNRLVKITFRSCRDSKDSDLCISLVADGGDEGVTRSPQVDKHGMATDSWWSIGCSKLPNRTLRLSQGTHSMTQLLKRYGFQDSTGCVNHRDATAIYDTKRVYNGDLRDVPKHLRDASGVPQFYARSGVCWFAALCWSSFANTQVRDFIMKHMPSDLQAHCERCLFSRDSAEELRKRLWFDYSVGDNIEDPPEMDGRNGFTEFSVMCARLGIPMIRFRESNGNFRKIDPRVSDRRGETWKVVTPKKLSDMHFLVLRFQDGDHKRFPICRRLKYKTQRYRLVGLYMGQRKCGHQIGISFPTENWRSMSIGDADFHKDGIGPKFIRFNGHRWVNDWWAGLRHLVHITKFGRDNNEFCSLSPWNEKDDTYDNYRSSHKTGSNSIDAVYIPAL